MRYEPISTATAEHYTWGDQCDGWRLVERPGLSVIEERMPAGTAERRHTHGKAQQVFYVLEGELTLELAGARHTLQAREGLEISPGVPHQAFNHSSKEVHFLVTSQPSTQGDRTDV